MKKKLRVIDFFCGAGGFSEGFKQAGFNIVMGVDNWLPAIETHNANHGLNDLPKNILDFENINEINKLPNTEIIIGSPPCVLFSLSNHGGNKDKSLGVQLIESFYRIIAVKKHQKKSTLKAWLMENVPNSRNYIKEKYTFYDLKLDKWAKTQGINPKKVAIYTKNNGAILKSNDYGSAQTRRRFVCGEIISTGKFPIPSKINKPVVTLNKLFHSFPKPISKIEDNLKIVDPNYPNICIKAFELHDHFYDTGVYEIEWKKAKEAKQNHPYMGKMSIPENYNKPSRTIMATRSASTREAILYKSELKRKGNGEYRTPTIREAAIIMGFPITYQFFGDESIKWRQVGNAVCVQLSLALANQIKKELNINLLYNKNIKPDFSKITYLDNRTEKIFNKPPKRNPKALFRVHPVKAANMTVDFTNQIDGVLGNWGAVAYVGTGRGYLSIKIDKKKTYAAKKLLNKKEKLFIKELGKKQIIPLYTKLQLNEFNKEYGFVSNNPKHPYNVINKISQLINRLTETNNRKIKTINTPLEEIKKEIPLNQIMSIYLLGILALKNNQKSRLTPFKF